MRPVGLCGCERVERGLDVDEGVEIRMERTISSHPLPWKTLKRLARLSNIPRPRDVRDLFESNFVFSYIPI